MWYIIQNIRKPQLWMEVNGIKEAVKILQAKRADGELGEWGIKPKTKVKKGAVFLEQYEEHVE